MFNLENKITWKELAPSLQAMFKTLQSQITDVKNEVNNINISLGDINDHLTQIDKDITNINENMTTIIRDTVEDMAGEMMFLNLAPKIGYYQEDKIEVISKYNMNYDVNTAAMITIDNLEREVIYVMASDGSPNYTNYKLYYGYRTITSDNSLEFSFVNEPLSITDRGTSYIVDRLIGLDEDQIVIKFTDKTIIYNTHNSTDSTSWTVVKDITTHYNQTINIINIYHIKWFPQYGTYCLLCCRTTPICAHVDDHLTIYTYRVSDDSLLLTTKFGNLFDYITFTDPKCSFSDKEWVSVASANNITVNNGFNNWYGRVITWVPSKEFIAIEELMLRFNYRYANSSATQGNPFPEVVQWGGPSFRFAFKAPIGIAKGTSNSGIYCYNNDYDDKKCAIRGYNVYTDNTKLGTNMGSMSKLCMSYATNHGYIYTTGSAEYGDNEFTKGGYKININQTYDEPFYYLTKYENVVKNNTITSNNTPDASLWGKFIKRYRAMNDCIMYYGISKQGKSFFYVKKFQKIKGFETEKYIEPVAGQYVKLSSISNINSTNSNIKTSNGEAKFYSVWDNKIREEKLNNDKIELVDIGSYTQFDKDPSIKSKLCQALGFSNENSYVQSSLQYLGTNTNKLIGFYTNTLNDNSDQTARRTYFAILNSNGTLYKVFGKDYESKYDVNYKGINNGAHNWIGHGYQTNNPGPGTYIESTRSYYFVMNWSKSSDNYGYCCSKIVFNSDFTDFTMYAVQNHPSLYCYAAGGGGLYQAIYTGTKYGFTYQFNGWKTTPGWPMYFQKKLFSNEGKDYTDEEFLDNMGTNSNIYYMYLQSSQGLVAYIPSIPIFLGGYFSIIENPIPVTLKPNSDNYIYIERDSNDRTSIIASSSTTRTINEGDKVFNKILCAKVTTDSANMISVEYYRINTGYNDYSFS